MSDPAQDELATEGDVVEPEKLNPHALWPGDTGTLTEPSRRAVLTLLRGPYLSYRRHPQLWSALLRDQEIITARLHELFLDLVIDTTGEVAYARNVDAADFDAPKTMRSASLTFMDTAMLLLLRQHLVSANSGERVIVGLDDLVEQLDIYRESNSDASEFRSRVRASWANFKRYGLISDAGSEDRAEISPVLRLVFGPDQIRGLREGYARIAARGVTGGGDVATIDVPMEGLDL